MQCLFWPLQVPGGMWSLSCPLFREQHRKYGNEKRSENFVLTDLLQEPHKWIRFWLCDTEQHTKLQSSLIDRPLPMACFLFCFLILIFFWTGCCFQYLDASRSKWLRSCHHILQHTYCSELGTNGSQRKNREHGAIEAGCSSEIVGVS